MAASTRDGAELIRLYEGPDCDEAGVRIDALRALAGADPAAAQPVLRQAIEGPEDAWVTVFPLDLVQEWRLVELRDGVRTAEGDPRRVVASLAASVGKRLDKRA